MTNIQNHKAVKRSFWIAFAFYFLIGFEFFYMISPFAVYFYSIYQPGLEVMNSSSTLTWLSQIFLPHIVFNSHSVILNNLMDLGLFLAFGGFGIFCIGAAQVYHSKLTRKQEVTGGVYNWVRHPQYAALIVSGFGMLILWPRYITLLSYLSMLFMYYFLARVEERECAQKYGQRYLDYKSKTAMFFPFPLKISKKISIFPQKGLTRYMSLIAFFIASCLIGIGAANQVRDWSLRNLYAVYNDNQAYIAVMKVEAERLNQIISIAQENSKVKSQLKAHMFENIKTINYIIPFNYQASEIPMRQSDQRMEHVSYKVPENLSKYKIIFTKSVLRNEHNSKGIEIISNSADRIPLLEVYVDVKRKLVYKIEGPFKGGVLEKIPLPVF